MIGAQSLMLQTSSRRTIIRGLPGSIFRRTTGLINATRFSAAFFTDGPYPTGNVFHFFSCEDLL